MKVMNAMRVIRLTAALALVAPMAAQAQGGGGVAQRRAAQMPPGRGMAEQRLGQLLREQLQLSDAQVTRLQETMQKYNPRREAMVQEERQVRESIRAAICSDDRSRGEDVSRMIDQMLELERRRIDLRMEEQRDLAAFLTPYQRARFLGTAELIQRRLEGPGPGGPGGLGGRGGRRGGPPPDGARPQGGRGGPPLDACGNPVRNSR